MLPTVILRQGRGNLVTEHQEMKGVMKTGGRLPQKPLTSCSLPELTAHIKAEPSSHSQNCPGHHPWLLDAADGQVARAPRVLKGDADFQSESAWPGSVLGEAAVSRWVSGASSGCPAAI